MTHESKISHKHPRAESLSIREKILKYQKIGVVARAGLIAHGRGETFDYLIGEKTWEFSVKAIRAAIPNREFVPPYLEHVQNTIEGRDIAELLYMAFRRGYISRGELE